MIQIKKFAIPLSVSGSLLLAILLWVLFFKQSNIYDAVPRSAVAVLEVNNWTQLYGKLATSTCGVELKKTAVAVKLKDELSLMAHLVAGNKTLQQKANLDLSVVSLHLTSAEDFDYLFTVKSSISDKELLNQLNDDKSVRTVKMRTFRNQQVYDVALANGAQLTFAVKKGILIFSFTAFLTESSVTALISGDNLGSSKEFNSVLKRVAETGDFKLFFNFRGAETILPVSIRNDKVSLLGDLSHFATWAGYAVVLNNEEMRLTGIAASVNDKTETSIHKNVLTSSLFALIPDNSAYVNIGMNHFDEQTGKNKTPDEPAKAWAGDSRAIITLEPFQEDFNDQNIFFLEIKDKGKALEDLKNIAGPFTSVDTFNNREIYSIEKDISGMSSLFRSSLTQFHHGFFTLRNDVFIFCNNKDVLKFTLQKIEKGETLNKDPKFINAAGHVSVSSVLYINPQRSNLLFKSLIKPQSEFINYLSQFNSIISESDIEGNLTGNTIVLKSGGANNQNGGLLWKTKLLYTSDYTPQIVQNSNTGDKEIFTQDTAGNIYLISKSGEILFTKNIGEKIISNVYQIDYYNNDKLQYIFNTAGHIYIVDRVGHYVAQYPLRLSGAATTGLTMGHNPGTNSYQYYVPCNNGSVYGYESTGRPLPGWSPKNSLGIVSQPLFYYSHEKISLLLAFNDAGKLMAFDNKGVLKWGVDNLPISKQTFSLINQGSDFALLNAVGNQLIVISADGNDNIRHLIDTAGSFTATATSDSTYAYFFSTGNSVRCYDKTGVFKTAIGFKAASISGVNVIEIQGKKYLQVTGAASNKVLVFKINLLQEGEKSGDPDLYGELSVPKGSSFKITNLFNTNELIGITADKDAGVSCYRIR